MEKTEKELKYELLVKEYEAVKLNYDCAKDINKTLKSEKLSKAQSLMLDVLDELMDNRIKLLLDIVSETTYSINRNIDEEVEELKRKLDRK